MQEGILRIGTAAEMFIPFIRQWYINDIETYIRPSWSETFQNYRDCLI